MTLIMMMNTSLVQFNHFLKKNLILEVYGNFNHIDFLEFEFGLHTYIIINIRDKHYI